MAPGPVKAAELVIIGAGPAGICAAIEATKAGVHPVILDENPKPGGRVYWQHADGLQVIHPDKLSRDYHRGRKILTEMAEYAHRITHLTDATVFALFPNQQLAYVQQGRCRLLKYEKLIVATGAYDRPVPLPGWTLPGVITVGAAQSLVKMQGVLPGRRIVLAGCGPLLWVVAWQILNAGGRLIALVDAGKVRSWPRLLIRLAEHWDIACDALAYWTAVKRSKIPIYRSHIPLEIHGNNQVEGVSVAPIDQHWRPRQGKVWKIETDTICLGYGLVPDVALTRLAGCSHDYLTEQGGWIPVRNRDMQTTVQSVYAVGDCAGVAGRSAAEYEGRLVGIAAALSLGYLSEAQMHSQSEPWRKRVVTLARLRQELDQISAFCPGLYQLARPATVICRCEEVTLALIKKAIEMGYSDLNEIKRYTRAGMGRCQGRMCGPAMQEIVSQSMGVRPETISALSVRPPLKPLKLGMISSLVQDNSSGQPTVRSGK